jgi:hypothetical protein
MKSMLDSVTKLVAVSSFAAFVLSASHEFGYFWVVGLPYLAMSSAYDYLSNSVLWLPFTLLLLGVFTQPNYEAAVDTGFPSERKSKVFIAKGTDGCRSAYHCRNLRWSDFFICRLPRRVVDLIDVAGGAGVRRIYFAVSCHVL